MLQFACYCVALCWVVVAGWICYCYVCLGLVDFVWFGLVVLCLLFG